MEKKLKVYAGMSVVFLVVLSLVLVFDLDFSKATNYPVLDKYDGEAVMYKSMNCGCCVGHKDYLDENSNLKVRVVKMEDLDSIKDKYGVPKELRSCHTLIIGDYFVEGHVPLEAIEKLMEEKPDIAGISLPGMPSGSPGMPGDKTEEWVIYSVNHDGSYQEFMRI